MTPKEKAKQLVDSYTHKLPAPSQCEKIDYPVFIQGKLIASMVCSEVMKACINYDEATYEYYKQTRDCINVYEL